MGLGNGQKLTSPTVQALALQAIFPFLKSQFESEECEQVNVVDIGFGYGCTTAMLALLAQHLSQKAGNKPYTLTGWEIYADFIPKAYQAFDHVESLDKTKVTLNHFDVLTEDPKHLSSFTLIHSA